MINFCGFILCDLCSKDSFVLDLDVLALWRRLRIGDLASYEISSTNCFDTGGLGWAAKCCMMEVCKFLVFTLSKLNKPFA